MTRSRFGAGDAIAGLAAPARMRYVQGMLLDAWHFDLERAYFNRKRQLLNRAALGAGVLCGLQVAPTADAKAVAIGPGVALDALGRELVVPFGSAPIDPRQPTDGAGRPVGDRIEAAAQVHLCLVYHECEAEPAPVRFGDCADSEDCANSVVCERYAIVVRAGLAPAAAPTCGLPGVFAAPTPGDGAAAIHARLVQRISQACAEVEGEACVVLANVALPASASDPITAEMIDIDLRRLVYSNDLLFELMLCMAGETPASPAPALALTRITDISWEHGKPLRADVFADAGIEVTFSNALEATALTTNPAAWLVVSVEYPVLANPAGSTPKARPGTTLHVQQLDGETAPGPGARTVSFRPATGFLDTFKEAVQSFKVPEQRMPLCRVVLKCSALLDTNNRAVDGDFLGGILPTGDGIPGGQFESWFLLDRQS